MLQSGIYLGKYRIIRLIGSGGMADVYEAEDTTLGRHVALKVLPPEFARDPERVARFQKEVRAAAQLSHPNIVMVYETGEDMGYYFYSMQLVTGGDLKSRIREGVIPEEALTILKQIAMSLQEAHSHGFVHRDIKPENILFDDKGNALLTDLGIARVMGNGTKLTKTGISIGTPHYMSPEQARGLNVDGRSDLYSLGIVFYEMLMGNVPYDAQETFAIGLKHINDPLPELPSYLKKYQPILDNLLAKDPSDRYQNADELIKDIDHILSGGSLKRPSHIFQKISEASKKGYSWIWALSGAGLAIIVVISLYGNNLLNLLKPPTRIVIGGGSAIMSHPAVPNSVKSTPHIPASIKPIPEVTVPKNMISKKPSSSTSPTTVVKKGSAVAYINSIPKGADIYLDGIYQGKTPLQADNFPSGKHEIVLKHKYYNSIKEKLILKSDVVYKKSYTLKKGLGSITVLSTPKGATVYLDGKKQEGVTPLTLKNILAGEHEITIHKDKYYDSKDKIEVLPQKITKLNATLAGGNLVSYKDKWVEPQKARELKKKNLEELIEKAKEQIKEQKFKIAQQYIALAKKLFPSSNRLRKVEKELKEARFNQYVASARIYLKKRKLQKAKQSIEKAKVLFPSDSVISVLLSKWKKKKREKVSQIAGEFVWVPGGCFKMGDTFGNGYDDEKPIHTVCLEGFYMGKYEVTFKQYDRFYEATGRKKPNDEGWGRGNRPVINVSWYDATAFAKWLSKKTGLKFHLPTEAEWEYAARSGGRKVEYATSTGHLSHDLANYDGTDGRDRWTYTSPIGSFPPNPLGLYDMSGNVAEWCSDWYNKNYYSHSPKNNPKGPSQGIFRVIRGGGWLFDPERVRCSYRYYGSPNLRNSYVGFRLVLDK